MHSEGGTPWPPWATKICCKHRVSAIQCIFLSKMFFLRKGIFWENLSLIILDLNNTFILGNLYINLACLSVCLSVLMFGCLFVCLYPINVKTAKPIGPKFLRFMNDQNFKYLSSSTLIFIKFLKILKIHEIFLWKSANYFCFVLRCTQREHVHN